MQADWKSLPAYMQTLIQESGTKIFLKDYRKIIGDNIDAVADLEEAGYKKDKIIALLTHEPLAKWPKVVRRLLEQKKQT